MSDRCNQCHRDLSIWDVSRVMIGRDKHNKKIVKYICTECLGHGENVHTIAYEKEVKEKVDT